MGLRKMREIRRLARRLVSAVDATPGAELLPALPQVREGAEVVATALEYIESTLAVLTESKHPERRSEPRQRILCALCGSEIVDGPCVCRRKYLPEVD